MTVMIKRTLCGAFALIFCFILSISLVSCTPETGAREKPTVITTVFAAYDFARQVAGDRAEVSLLLDPGTESHTFEPTPRDMIEIGNCDLFICIGGESEAWVDHLLAGSDRPSGSVLRLIEHVTTLEEEIVEGMETEGGEEEEAPELDEHIWTSPRCAMQMTDAICAALCTLLPDDSATFTQNAADYRARLDALDHTFRTIVGEGKRSTILFADRFPCRYFAHEYGLTYYAAFPGCADRAEPSAATVAFLIDRVKEKGIPVVFYIEFSNEKIADTVCEATGARKLLFHSCHNVSRDALEAGVTYLSLMEQNAQNLRAALAD